MRPVKRGDSPRTDDYDDYKTAKTELISRFCSGWINGKHLASYCSYCERKIETNLAVEHIEPKKGNFGQPQLIGRWTNFLLACVNCNSTKKDKQVILNNLFFLDRDNTFFAFEYLADGNIIPSTHMTVQNTEIAQKTLALVGLDKKLREDYDNEGNLIAQERASQRMQAWGIAKDCLDYDYNPNNQRAKNAIVKVMVLNGFFSVWMTVFNDYPDMKNLFIDAIKGTRESGCFDLNAQNISPHPNTDNLQNGGKI